MVTWLKRAIGLAADHDSGPLETFAEKNSTHLPQCLTHTNGPDTSALWSHSLPTHYSNMRLICNFSTVCVGGWFDGKDVSCYSFYFHDWSSGLFVLAAVFTESLDLQLYLIFDFLFTYNT